MAAIDFTHAHTESKQDAKDAVGNVARDLEERLDAQSRWDGDTLHFERSGADGRLEVREDQVRVVIDLGFLLKPMKGRIRSEAEALLEKHLSQR